MHVEARGVQFEKGEPLTVSERNEQHRLCWDSLREARGAQEYPNGNPSQHGVTGYGCNSQVNFTVSGIDLSTHEIVERRMVARYVRPQDRVLEGGAGIGAVTRVMLDAGAIVTAFEPGPEQFPYLQRLTEAYPSRCRPIQKALAEYDGEVPLHLYHPWIACRTTALGGCVPYDTIRVQARGWSSELETGEYTGLVIDIEGAEHGLLASSLPEKLRWIVAELHGTPEEMAQTLLAPCPAFKLDAVEAHLTYLVAGWVRA